MTSNIEVIIRSDISPLFESAKEEKADTELFSKALALYPYIKNETISHGKAAQIIGISKWELIEIYSKFGFAYIDMDEAEFEQECETVKRILGNMQ